MTKEYESKILACKESGFNGTFEDIDEKKLGRTTPMMQYMHQYFKSNPALKDVAISLLPPGTFYQSSSGPPPARNTSRGNLHGGSGEGSGKKSDGSLDAQQALDSIAKKKFSNYPSQVS